MRIAIAQLNPTVGDFAGNLAKAEKTLDSLRRDRPDLVVFTEMFLTGYPPLDLLERGWFVRKAEDALTKLADISRKHPHTGILVGTVLRSETPVGKGLHNSAVLIANGEIQAAVHKALLPTYDVFDEARYFDPGEPAAAVSFKDANLGITICEDAWNDPALWRRPVYDRDPVAELARCKATLLINISASPFAAGKDSIRYRLFDAHAKRHKLPFVVVNQVGGNDELLFDGRSMCVAPEGGLLTYLPAFREDVRVIDPRAGGSRIPFSPDDPVASTYGALLMGLRDYVGKCGFHQVLVGLSGGIDSALVCAIAADALGPENVLGVTMPSPYSSPGSIEDSRALATNLGIELATIPIADVYGSYLRDLTPYLAGDGVTVTKENIQARVRGNILMALSNEQCRLLLSTGNKSELAVGYCTLYGDMSGGLAVISDVPKTMVYALARHANRDQDTLPPYEVLDPILDLYVEEGRSPDEIVAKGYDRKTVEWVVRAVNGNEYKRRQAVPGLKVTSKAFGMGRRMPIAARYQP
jgi:NAD+ synthase (glutamine-hydrolysing)